MSNFLEMLSHQKSLLIRQKFEMAELFGFETRNKYSIESEDGVSIGFAAEQQKGFWGLIFRGFFGHWRRFDIFIFDSERNKIATLHHPFRWFFQRIEVRDQRNQLIGSLQQRFSILSKNFDVEDAFGRAVMTVRSPVWKFWTFVFKRGPQEVGRVEKKWSGLLNEVFTDRDHFRVSFSPSVSDSNSRLLQLSAGLFVDLQYFEKRASSN
ncbi:MAG: hypothetical protein KDD25_10295 [Bdellovibrionales bacterium]|nr:hypothetical protein [Bdellovibrionales bacterium]